MQAKEIDGFDYIDEIQSFVADQAELTRQIVSKVKNKDIIANYLLNFNDTIRDKLDEINRRNFPQGRKNIPITEISGSYETLPRAGETLDQSTVSQRSSRFNSGRGQGQDNDKFRSKYNANYSKERQVNSTLTSNETTTHHKYDQSDMQEVRNLSSKIDGIMMLLQNQQEAQTKPMTQMISELSEAKMRMVDLSENVVNTMADQKKETQETRQLLKNLNTPRDSPKATTTTTKQTNITNVKKQLIEPQVETPSVKTPREDRKVDEARLKAPHQKSKSPPNVRDRRESVIHSKTIKHKPVAIQASSGVVVQKGVKEVDEAADNNLGIYHIQTIGRDFLLVSFLNEVVNVYRQDTKEFLKRLHVGHLFSSLVHDDIVLLGSFASVIILASESMEVIAQIPTQNSVFSLCMFDETTFLCGQYDGFMDVVSTVDSQLRTMFQGQLEGIDDIYAIKRSKWEDEIILGGAKGVYFGRVKDNILYLTTEVYLPSQWITQIHEYAPNKYLIGKRNDTTYVVINRELNQTRILKPEHRTEKCTYIRPLPGFDEIKFPYFLARNRATIDLINITTMKVYPLVKSLLKQIFPFESTSVVTTNPEGTQFKVFYIENHDATTDSMELRSVGFNSLFIIDKLGRD